jgi:predicted deacylase
MLDDWIGCPPGALDLERRGLTRWLLALDYSWQGREAILDYPVIVANNGEGPCVLLVGGTHGDEFEGQIVATRLAAGLAAEDVTGTLIILPTHNRPAALAGLRRSPLDGADLNRLYPGRDGAGPSHAIARFVTERLIAACDAVIDIHSGGATHEFVLSSNLQGRYGTPACARDLPALLAFDAPYAILFDEVGGDSMPHGGTLEGAAIARGKRAFSSEIGGAGRLTPDSLAVAERGVVNLLRSLGVLAGPKPRPEESRSRLLALCRPEHYVSAPARGHFRPLVWLGAEVEAGQTLGELYRLERPGEAPLPIAAASAGTLVTVASRGIVDPSEPVFFVAEPVER